MQKTQVPSLGGEDPLKKEMATYSSILAWEIPHTEEPSGLQPRDQTQVSHIAGGFFTTEPPGKSIIGL